jgi:hypothetical protein
MTRERRGNLPMQGKAKKQDDDDGDRCPRRAEAVGEQFAKFPSFVGHSRQTFDGRDCGDA